MKNQNQPSAFATLVLLIGCTLYGIRAYNGFEPIEWLAEKAKTPILAQAIYAIIGFAGLVKLLDSSTYTALIGTTKETKGVLMKPTGERIKVMVRVPPNRPVMYWSAEPNQISMPTPWQSSEDFKNSGTTKSDSSGLAILKVNIPSKHESPAVVYGDQLLARHVYYCYKKESGKWSGILTKVI